MENELYHHGIKGQRWGVRRYQNPDGSLTLAGKKRALKVQNDYTELSKNKKYHDKDGNLTYEGRKRALKMKEQYSSITGKSLRPFPNTSGLKSSTSVKGESKVKPKSISEMSDQEIQTKIDRIRLENNLKSLTPEEISRGRKLVDGLKDAAIDMTIDRGTKLVGDYIDKQLRNKLGLTDKQVKSASELLKEKAQDMENKKKITQVEDYYAQRAEKAAEKEARKKDADEKEARKKDAQKQVDDYNNSGAKQDSVQSTSYNSKESDMQYNRTYKNTPLLDAPVEKVTGTVEGEGTSRYNPNSRYKNDFVEGVFTDIKNESYNSSNIRRQASIGQNYVNQLLLEDKNK